MEDEWDLAAVSADHDFAGASDQVAGFESKDLHIELLFVGHCLTAKVVSPSGCHDRVGFFTGATPALLETVGKNTIQNRCRVALRACLIAMRMQFSGKTVRRYNRRGISPYTGGRSRPSPRDRARDGGSARRIVSALSRRGESVRSMRRRTRLRRIRPQRASFADRGFRGDQPSGDDEPLYRAPFEAAQGEHDRLRDADT